MIMPAVGRFTIIMFVNRNLAINTVVVMLINAYLRHGVRRTVNRPGRNRRGHAHRQPKEGEQMQQRADRSIHSLICRRCGKLRQSRFETSSMTCG